MVDINARIPKTGNEAYRLVTHFFYKKLIEYPIFHENMYWSFDIGQPRWIMDLVSEIFLIV